MIDSAAERRERCLNRSILNKIQYLYDNQIEVINDLTTGGIDDALSAEQGKVLAESIEDAVKTVNNVAPDENGNVDVIVNTVVSAADVTFSPTSSVISTDVQSAIEEVDSATEASANKQNSLATDGTGTKFPTVDAVNGIIKQTTGTSETDVMSQKAVTDELALKEATANKQNSLATDGTGTKFPTVDAVNGIIKQTTGTSETDVMSQKAVTTIADLVPALQPLQTVANRNQYYPIIENNEGLIVGKHQTAYWNGSAWVGDSSFGIGKSALQSNTGAYSNGVGAYALQNNTGATANGVGAYALQSNTGTYSNGVGHYALQSNKGVYSNGVGYYALQSNTGAYSNGVGSLALQNNTGAYSNGLGTNALQSNTGANSSGMGSLALLNNTGANANGVGNYALVYNQKTNNSAFGHNAYSAFLDNAAGNKTADSTAVDITLERITITAHGFGATNTIVNIKYASTTGTAVGGLAVGTVYQVKIIDANTIEFVTGAVKRNLTSQGTGTHTFTPQFAYENTTCLGANTQPNKDNQVVLGDTAVDTVKMGGTARTIASATATGVKGEWCWDADYIYVCIATNTWKRIALTTW